MAPWIKKQLNRKTAIIGSILLLLVIAAVASMIIQSRNSRKSAHENIDLKRLANSRPERISRAYLYKGGRCPVDSSSPQPQNGLIALSSQANLTLDGWMLPETPGRKLAPWVYLVLTGADRNFYFEGNRVPRPDVAKGNAMLQLAGYHIVAPMQHVPPGNYRVSLAASTEFVQMVCSTEIYVQVTQ